MTVNEVKLVQMKEKDFRQDGDTEEGVIGVGMRV